MNILVTGSKGFIGSHLTKRLKQNHKVFFVEHDMDFSLVDNRFRVNLLNINHINLLVKQEVKIDVLIHTASRFGLPLNGQDISVLDDNILMYKNLTHMINVLNPKQVINLSSIAVYPNKDGNYKETSEIRPSVNSEGLYGLSKFVGENILDLLCKKCNILNLRLAQVYGEGMRSDRIFEIMKKQLEDRNVISIYGNGERTSGFIHIDSLVERYL
jgi:nucleoside-diphosphate-sugar epimerase